MIGHKNFRMTVLEITLIFLRIVVCIVSTSIHDSISLKFDHMKGSREELE